MLDPKSDWIERGAGFASSLSFTTSDLETASLVCRGEAMMVRVTIMTRNLIRYRAILVKHRPLDFRE